MVRILIVLLLFSVSQALGQNNFRSAQSGDWNQSASWEEFIGGTWQATVNTPTSASGTITIRNGHTITVTAGVSIDRTIVDAGAVLAVNDAINVILISDPFNSLTVNGTLSMLGESFLSGTGNVAVFGAIRLGSLNGTGAIVTGTTLGNVRSNRGFVNGASIIYAGTGAQFIGDGTPATAGIHTVIDNANGVSLNNTASTLVSITGNLTILQGSLTVQNNNLSVNSATSTTTLSGGNLIMTSAAVARTFTARNIVLNGGNITISSGNATTACTVNGSATLTAGNFTINSSAFLSTLTLNSTLALNGGTLAINSSTENATLNVNGDITGTSFVTFTGSNSNLNVNGSGQLSRDFPINAVTTLEAVILDRLNSTVVIPQNLLVTRSVRITRGDIDANAGLTVNSNLDINAGSTLFFENQQLSVNGLFNSIPGYTGVLSSNSSSILNIIGTGMFNTLAFSGSGNTIGTLLLNRPTGGTLVTLNSPLTIVNSLYLQDGSLQNTSGLNMNAGATLTLNSNASLTGSAPAGGPYNLIYEGASPLSTQLEAQGSLQNVTNNTNATVTITAAMNIPGILTLNSGTVSNASGFLSMGNGATIIRNQGTTFTGAAPSGGPYNLIYNGTTSSTGTEATGSINNVTSNLTGTLTLSSAVTASGTFLIAAGTVTAGANAVSVAILQNQATFNSPSVNLTLTGNLINDGVFNAGTGTVIFNGASTLSGTAISTTNFNNITINPAASLTPPATLNVLGNFDNNGSFAAGAGTVSFSGTVGSKVLSGTTNTQFNNLTLNKSNVGVSLTVNSPQTVVNTLSLVAGQLNLPASNITLNNGATLIRNSSGSITTNSPAGGPWNLIYTGGSQTTSLEIPASGIVTTLTLNTNNPSIVTLNQSLIVNGLFSNPSSGRTFTSGANNISLASFSNAGTFNAPTSAAATGLTMTGSFANNGTYTHSSGTLVIAGAVTMSGTTIDATNFNHITVNGGATLTPSAVLNVQGNFTNNGSFAAGTNTVNFSGTTGSRVLSGTTNTQFFDVVLNKGNAGVSVSVTSPQTITNSLTLTAGQLDITGGNLSLNNLSTLTRSSGLISTSSPSGGPWNLVYTGGNKTTSLEIPASGAVESLTVNTNNSTTVTLNQNLAVNGLFTILSTGRSFTAGNFNVSVGSFSNAGTFNAPTAAAPTGFTITGNFVNGGTFAPSNGTVFINGPVTMSGATITTTTFNDLTILGPGNLTPAAILNISGNFANNGTFTAGAGTVAFTGITGSKTLSGSTNTLFNNLTLNKTNVGLSLTVSSAQTITNSLTLLAGQLNIPTSNLSFNNGATLTRNSGSQISGGSPGGGPWNLIYTGGNLNTGFEIPAFDISSLTVNSNSAAVITLTSNLQITNSLTITQQASGPTFTSGAHTVSAGSITNGGILNAPTPASNLILTGDLTNNGTFNRGTGTVVFNGTSNINGTDPVFHNITIAGILNRPADLFLTGNFVNNGTFSGASGAINFNGSATQTIGGTTTTDFFNINVNNTGGPVSVASNQNLVGTLTVSANAQFDADGAANTAVFTILSIDDSPLQDGRVAALLNGASVTGAVRAQRFMIPSTGDDRFISSPITNATVAQLQESFSITGNFTGTSYPCNLCESNEPTMYYYDETFTGQFPTGYLPTPVGGGSNTETLVPGRGYDVFMWDNPGPILINYVGPLTQGTVNFTVSRTNSVPPIANADGWNLVGNPYASAIQWNGGAGWAMNLIDPTVYVWDRLTSSYRTYNFNTASGTLSDGIIATGQAFWVYAYPGAVSMSINEQAKIAPNNNSGYYRERTNPTPSSLKISLTNGNATDESLILMNENATPEFDFGMDAPKLITSRNMMLVASLDKDQHPMAHLAINANSTTLIPLYIQSNESGNHELKFIEEGSSGEFSEWQLVDRYLGVNIPIASQGTYSFKVTQADASKVNRFFLSTNLETLAAAQPEKPIHITAYPNPVSGILNVEINSDEVTDILFFDNLGKSLNRIPHVSERGVSTGYFDATSFPKGVYFIKVRVEGKVLIEKIIKY